MNPTIRIQTPSGAYTTFELDEHIVTRQLGPSKLLEFMMAFYQAQTFTNLTSLELLPLEDDLAQAWQDEHQVPWFVKLMDPTVEWRFEERLAATTKANGPPIAVVHGNVVLSVFSHVAAEFFGEPGVIAAVRRS